MEKFVTISTHINNLLECFGKHFDHESMSRTECMEIFNQSNSLHNKLVTVGDLRAYDQHVELAKFTYRLMLNKINSQQLAEDILFCGSSERTWEETSKHLSSLYQLTLSSKEVLAFFYLDEINKNYYIDWPLPRTTTLIQSETFSFC